MFVAYQWVSIVLDTSIFLSLMQWAPLPITLWSLQCWIIIIVFAFHPVSGHICQYGIISTKMYIFFFLLFSLDAWSGTALAIYTVCALNLWASRPGKIVRETKHRSVQHGKSLTNSAHERNLLFNLYFLCLCFKTASVCCLVQQSACRCKLRSVISCLGTNTSDRMAAN